MKKSTIMLLVSVLAYAMGSHAAPPPANQVLTDALRCGAGNATGGILKTQVTGNPGAVAATDCWGLIDGNTPKKSFTIGSTVYNYVAKQDTPGGLSGVDIGLEVSPGGGALSGTWKFDQGALGGADFLIALKAANTYAVWLFSGPAAQFFSGDWQVSWGHNLSHLSIYSGGSVYHDVPVSGTLGLLGLGLLGLRFQRRKQS